MKINEIQLVKEIIILWKQLKTTQLFEIIKKEQEKQYNKQLT